MADNDKAMEAAPRGTDWEVVSLTASAYAAAPGPEQAGSIHDYSDEMTEENNGESSRTLFMSGHFAFPPSQHENLPLEDVAVVLKGANFMAYEKPGDVLKFKRHVPVEFIPVEFPGIPIFDDKGNILSAASGADVEKNAVHANEEACLSSLLSATRVENSANAGPEPDDQSSDSGFSGSPVVGKKLDDSPLEAWWRKKAVSFCSLAKETNTFWSIFVAAAVMGLVILGHRWQQERWHLFHLGRFDERLSRMIRPMSRLRDVVVGGHQRGSLLRGGASSER